MIAVLGTFRLPVDRVDEAITLMQQVIAETLKEPGCRAYSYAEDVAEPGLFRVMELWSDRAALGFHDRSITVHAIGQGEPV